MSQTEMNFAHLCDMAFLSKEGKLNIIGIFENINTNGFPIKHPKMSLVMNLTLQTGKHPFKIRLVNENDPKKAIRQVEGEMTCHKAGKSGIINDFLDLTFTEAGQYAFEIWVDDEPTGKIRFAVQNVSQ